MMRKVGVGLVLCGLVFVLSGAAPASAETRTTTVVWNYFGEHNVSCNIDISSSRTVEGSGAHVRTHFSLSTGIATTSDHDCVAHLVDLAANLTYRRTAGADPETIEMHSFGGSPTVLLDTTINGTVVSAAADHVATFDCSDVHPCAFHIASNPK